MESYEKACALFEKCGEPKQALHLYLHWGTATGIELVSYWFNHNRLQFSYNFNASFWLGKRVLSRTDSQIWKHLLNNDHDHAWNNWHAYGQVRSDRFLFGNSCVLLQAIELVGRLRCDALTSQLLDYLTGEMDQGVEKGPKYLFQLHTVLGNYEQATKAALLIAHQEQVQYYWSCPKSCFFSTT